MMRKAFLMTLKPGFEDEYEKRHNPIWPELESLLKTQGVHNYSIFLDRASGRLFGYVEVESEERWNAIAKTDECRRWWSYIKDLMDTNFDESPKSEVLKEVFHLD